MVRALRLSDTVAVKPLVPGGGVTASKALMNSLCSADMLTDACAEKVVNINMKLIIISWLVHCYRTSAAIPNFTSVWSVRT